MKIQVLSDLHLEHFPSDERALSSIHLSDQADAIVLAGDISSGEDAIRLLGPLATERRPFLLINGNHEFYDYDIEELRRRQLEASTSFPHLHFLDKNSIELAGVLFIGCTLWTSGNHTSNGFDRYTTGVLCNRNVEDFSVIGNRGKGFSFFESNELHYQELEFILNELDRDRPTRKVVVSHHAPTSRSIHPNFRNSTINVAFVSDIGDEILTKADIWIHGHTHASLDYFVDRTRVICNARGYPRGRYQSQFENANFNPELLIEV